MSTTKVKINENKWHTICNFSVPNFFQSPLTNARNPMILHNNNRMYARAKTGTIDPKSTEVLLLTISNHPTDPLLRCYEFA